MTSACNILFLVSVSPTFLSAEHPYSHLIDTLQDGQIKFFNPYKLNDPRYGELSPLIEMFSSVFKDS